MEREVKGVEAEIRRARRAEQAAPVLTRFRQWLDAQADIVLPKSPIGEAVGYARAQWTALTRYTEDGALAIDNNVSERALRPSVIFRKVTNGFRSEWGADTYAAFRSVVSTAKANRASVLAVLQFVLASRLPQQPLAEAG